MYRLIGLLTLGILLIVISNTSAATPTSYWSNFPKAKAAGWDKSTFFPIGVWYDLPENAQKLRDSGVNTMVVVANPQAGLLKTVGEQTGMFFIPQSDWTPDMVVDSPNVVGWFSADELDMTSQTPVEDQATIVNDLKSRDDGRFTYANYGKGIMNSWWSAGKMPALVSGVDVSSFDLYGYTDSNLPYELTFAPAWGSGNAASSGLYGWATDQLRSYAPTHPAWAFVELGHPFGGDYGGTNIPDHVIGSVWSEIIHGATGIIYFNHSFGGARISYHLIEDDPWIAFAVRQVNQQITTLAPVINTPTLVWNFNSGTDTILKKRSGQYYIFSGIDRNGVTGVKTFRLPTGTVGRTVTVLNEGRTIPVTNGTFTDNFQYEYTNHIYKLTA